jgi:hypothetical protein
VLTTTLIFIAAQASVAGPNSGFLDDYSSLKPDPDQKGAKIYLKPDADLGMYDKIIFDPIEIFYAPDTKYKGISPDELKLLADTFRDLMVKELEPKYPVIQTPGKGVLRARLAITNVKMKKKKRSVLGYMPIGAALTAVKDIAGLRVILSASMIEAELIDSETNETIGLLVDTSSSDTPEGKESWEALQESLTFYAKRFRKRLDAAH